MKFSKWHGLGNDFVIVNGFEENIDRPSEAAIKICHRRFGVGADGLVIISSSEKADFEMKIFNSDGSEAEMCGNVVRCVASYVYKYGLTDKSHITVETKAGIIRPQLILSGNENNPDMIRVDMGEPKLKSSEIPVLIESETVINVPLKVNDHEYNITCVSMGNPHCVIFVDDIEQVKVSELGPIIENHYMFPNKINVEFVEVINRNLLRMRVWERGAGITMACGTGACAALVAAVLNNKSDKRAVLQLDGGNLEIEWDLNNHIFMTGPAVEVFNGEL